MHKMTILALKIFLRLQKKVSVSIDMQLNKVQYLSLSIPRDANPNPFKILKSRVLFFLNEKMGFQCGLINPTSRDGNG